MPVAAFRAGALAGAPCVVTGHVPTSPRPTTARSPVRLPGLLPLVNVFTLYRLLTDRHTAQGPLPFSAEAARAHEQRRRARHGATAAGIVGGIGLAVAVQALTTAADGTRTPGDVVALLAVEAVVVVATLLVRRALRDRPRARLDRSGEHLVLDAVHPAFAAEAAARAASHRAVTPGWYPDPHGLPRHRWYDGAAWTDHVHPPS